MNMKSISADFPFASHYVEVHGAKLHYVDEGKGEPVLFLHGNPTSSYVWRNIIPYLTPHARCIAMDLVGMGKSDKPDIEYRFFDHVRYVEGFIEALGLKRLVLVLQDWGSALGFHYAMRHEANVKGIAFMEAIIMPIPGWSLFPQKFQEVFQTFRTPDVGWDRIVNKNVFIERVLPSGVARKLTQAEMDHYRAPYQDPASRKPLWRWPNEIPIEGHPQDVVDAVGAYNQWLQSTHLPMLLFHASPGAILPPSLVEWCHQNLRHIDLVDVGTGIHYLQEDNPHMIGAELAAWYSLL